MSAAAEKLAGHVKALDGELEVMALTIRAIQHHSRGIQDALDCIEEPRVLHVKNSDEQPAA